MIITITPPASEPVTLDEAKLHLRVDHGDEDALIGMLIASARSQAETRTGRRLMAQTVEVHLPGFKTLLRLPEVDPIRDVLSVEYLDTSGALQTVPEADYRRAGDALVCAVGKCWPAVLAAPDAVRVRVECGWPTADDVPAELKQWILLRVATAYKNREAVVEGHLSALPRDFTDGLLDAWKVW